MLKSFNAKHLEQPEAIQAILDARSTHEPEIMGLLIRKHSHGRAFLVRFQGEIISIQPEGDDVQTWATEHAWSKGQLGLNPRARWNAWAKSEDNRLHFYLQYETTKGRDTYTHYWEITLEGDTGLVPAAVL